MIQISKDIKAAIDKEGEKAFPNECCGFLLGTLGDKDERFVKEIIAIVNAKEEKEQYHRFVIEPDDFLKAQVAAMKKGLDILGFYHSHPDHPAKPSDYDKEHALPFYSYIIVSVQKAKADKFTSWQLSNDRKNFNEEKIFTDMLSS